MVATIQSYVHEAEVLFSRKSNNHSINFSSFEIEIQTKIKYENSIFLGKTRTISKRLQLIDKLISKKQRTWGQRNKRFVVAPVIGSALKFLFGTADNNDVLEIHEQIEQLGDTVNRIHHLDKIQATLIQTLHNDNMAQDAFLAKLGTATTSLANNLTKLRSDVQTNSLDQKQADYERRFMFVFLYNVEIIRDTIERANNIIQDLLVDISTIAVGKIPPPPFITSGSFN